MKNVLLWLAYFIPALIVEIFCYITNPIAAIFTYREPRLDVVKRLGKKKVTLPRDYLHMYLWQTHDNAADEWWYGMYNVNHLDFAKNWTQHDYDNSWWIRYYCRLVWLYRNNAYGWLYKLFSRPKEDAYKVYEYGKEDVSFYYKLELRNHSFKFELQIPLVVVPRYLSINIGWKAHKLTEKLLYANRIIGIRSYR